MAVTTGRERCDQVDACETATASACARSRSARDRGCDAALRALVSSTSDRASVASARGAPGDRGTTVAAVRTRRHAFLEGLASSLFMGSLAHKVVLLIRPEASARGDVCDALQRHGYLTWSASDGASALARLRQESIRPDLIVIDWTI